MTPESEQMCNNIRRAKLAILSTETRLKTQRNVLESQITLARYYGASWTDIADSLGMSRQSAWRQWSRVDSAFAASSPG